MSTAPRASLPLEQHRWATWLAGLVPLLVYTLSAGGHSYWLDSAEFTAAGVDLDIPHPPGHPVASLWAQLFCLVPIGPLPFRVAMAQATAAAVGASALQVAFARTFCALGMRAREAVLLSLGALAWLVFAYGYWFQAVRAEVYALQAMLIALSLERAVALSLDETERDPRALYAALLCLGLGLANHHFMSVLALPPLAVGFAQCLRKHGARVLGWCSLSGAVGLVGYLYLPLRAANEPAMDLGHPVDAKSLWWVVSAQVYARRIGSQAIQPLGERFADLTVILAEQFSLLSLPLALVGLYVLARERRSWSVGYVWAVTALVCLCGRAWLNPVRNNPDVLGYMIPGFAGYAVLCCAPVLAALRQLRSERARLVTARVAIALSLALGAAQLLRTRAQASLAGFHATDEFDRLRQAALPEDAVVFLTSPETAFRYWENLAVERARSDVDMVPTAFVNYGGVADVWVARRPALREAVQHYQREAALRPEALERLSQTRPVMIEPDLMAAWPLFDRMLPAGLLYRFTARPPTRDEIERAGTERSAVLRTLRARLGEELAQTETRRQLLWCHYIDALYYAQHGVLHRALASVQSGLALVPEERELLRLWELLRTRPSSFSLQAFVHPP